MALLYIDPGRARPHILLMHGDTNKLVAAGLFAVLLIVLVNVSWWVFYSRTEVLLDQQLGRRLESIAASTAALLDPGVVEGLVQDNFEAYFITADLLEDIRSTAAYSEIFIIDQNLEYLVTTAIVEDSTYLLARIHTPQIDSLFFGLDRGPIASPSYQTGDIFLKAAFAPLFDSSGVVTAVLGVEADVDYADALTDLRTNLYYSIGMSGAVGLILALIFILVQRRLNRVQRQLFLNQTQSYMGRMVAVVSHEIKNPLSIIRASAERLRKKHESAESSFIVEEVDRLNEIVSGYLDFASGGEIGFVGREQQEKINVGRLVEGLRIHFGEKYLDTDFQWIHNKIPVDLEIVGYRRSLRQVLLNLLINGADACREAERPIRVGIEVSVGNHRVDLSVVDGGPGIPRKDLDRIFEPFYTTRQTGSGLGLYLSQKIVEEMGGTLLISSGDGRGTKVTVRLPKKSEKT